MCYCRVCSLDRRAVVESAGAVEIIVSSLLMLLGLSYRVCCCCRDCRVESVGAVRFSRGLRS